MRGKCESCEFFEQYEDERASPVYDGSCHIRSVEDWPPRFLGNWCGEWLERVVEETFNVEISAEDIETLKELGIAVDEELARRDDKPDIVTEAHGCRCGMMVDIKVRGTEVVDWNGHGHCQRGMSSHRESFP